MRNYASIFIMDVTNSSKFNKENELSEYLKYWTDLLKKLDTFTNIKVKHRQGDEIICVVDDYFTAYILAFYMIIHWKYREHMPYFGISYGYFDEELNDIEIWNNPMVKQARLGNDFIKSQSPRNNLIALKKDQKENQYLLSNINLIIEMQNNLIVNQTDKQREVLALHSLLESQKEIANYVKKTQATTSSHYTKGNVELIFKAYKTIVDHLKLTQIKSLSGSEYQMDNLNQTIINKDVEIFTQKLKDILKANLL